MRFIDPDTHAGFPHTGSPLAQGLAYWLADEPDDEQAAYWFQVAGDAGDAEGLAMLALCQLDGRGLPRDATRARERLEQAVLGGSLTARYHLGRVLVAGWGGPADAERGVSLYTAAAAQGHADATFSLAACLSAGWGCHPDPLAAKALFMRARALGSPLRQPGLRIRERELDAVCALARRFDDGDKLPGLIDERQHELALMQDLVRHPERAPGRAAARRRRWLLGGSLGGLAIGLAAGLIHWTKRPQGSP